MKLTKEQKLDIEIGHLSEEKYRGMLTEKGLARLEELEQIKKKKFRFQIQNCIDVNIESDTKENARRNLIENIEDYTEEMINDCCVSGGEEVD